MSASVRSSRHSFRWSADDSWASVSLFVGTLLSRIPFRSQVLYHWDSVNFAFAMRRFDIGAEQPQPPGYIAYVWLCRLVDLLFGDLGAGKTTLTRGIAIGLGLAADIHSPTFTLIHEHPGAVPLYHVDLYRLSSEEEIETLGLDEYIYSDGVTIIEWADRMESLLPKDRLDITLRMVGDTERELTLETQSDRVAKLIETLCPPEE